ncbi:MAG: tripartite ATP-independent periplasmic transporter, DctQ component family protein [Ramlibacter sp.]|jgi:TRAP-type C4-dicarboxylate transport system permease small subunit|nr:tripartite ATP-independent periplasmic transporter, DctQ component family protein [Ramlibacter sp.]MCE3269780.1 tripartite ATP-independent periplasmic transporter, DctQ component family protein [Ramlibacter sp.]
MFSRGFQALHRFAEAVAAALLAVIFAAFIVQIVLRYVFNWPVGWTTELSLAAWLWLVLWGASFVLKDDEEIRIDLLVERVGPRTRRVLAAIAAISILVLFGMSLRASYDYVAFMKVEKSSYLGVRMDITYSIYIVFVVAVLLRALRQLVRAIRGTLPASSDPGATSSAL